MADISQNNDNTGISEIYQNNDISSSNVSTDSFNFSSNDSDAVLDSNLSSNVFGANDFEDVDISLEDLEKKNYNNFLNSSNNGIDDDNFYYSNLSSNSDNLDNHELNDFDQDINDSEFHAFDSESQESIDYGNQEAIDDLGVSDNEDDSKSSDDSSSIPELFDSSVDDSSQSDDSQNMSNDDIWKF